MRAVCLASNVENAVIGISSGITGGLEAGLKHLPEFISEK
jgi:hypothetical protein